MTKFFETPQERRIAYEQADGQGPGIVFLSGLKSDMEGTKAVHLEAWAKAQGRAFLRFDYSGHGMSSGQFEDGTIGDWAQDAVEAISSLTAGPQVLVGSSMGGWISLILSTRLKDKICGIVGIAAAPDFTEEGFWSEFDDAQKVELAEKGRVALPSEYGEPYIITKQLIEDGRAHLVLRKPLMLPYPCRFLQGTADTAVPMAWATRLLEHATGPDIQLTIVKDADHRFSAPDNLALIERAILDVSP